MLSAKSHANSSASTQSVPNFAMSHAIECLVKKLVPKCWIASTDVLGFAERNAPKFVEIKNVKTMMQTLLKSTLGLRKIPMRSLYFLKIVTI